jgi:hypothetical protein
MAGTQACRHAGTAARSLTLLLLPCASRASRRAEDELLSLSPPLPTPTPKAPPGSVDTRGGVRPPDRRRVEEELLSLSLPMPLPKAPPSESDGRSADCRGGVRPPDRSLSLPKAPPGSVDCRGGVRPPDRSHSLPLPMPLPNAPPSECGGDCRGGVQPPVRGRSGALLSYAPAHTPGGTTRSGAAGYWHAGDGDGRLVVCRGGVQPPDRGAGACVAAGVAGCRGLAALGDTGAAVQLPRYAPMPLGLLCMASLGGCCRCCMAGEHGAELLHDWLSSLSRMEGFPGVLVLPSDGRTWPRLPQRM